MDDEDPMAVWRALVGESDDNSFHGFAVKEVMRGDESDVDSTEIIKYSYLILDLDIIVQVGHSGHYQVLCASSTTYRTYLSLC